MIVVDREDPKSRIYDWNLKDRRVAVARKPPQLLDETIRDGLQSPTVRDPSIDDKLALIRAMVRLGIHAVNLGLPGAGPRARADVARLLGAIVDEKLPIVATCAARTVLADITPALELAQQLGAPLEVCMFVGSSPIRSHAEGWELDRLVQVTREAVTAVVRAGLPATFVTEDTTRSHPAVLDTLFRVAIDAGATRLVLADTCGHATLDGVRNLVGFTRAVLRALDVEDRVAIDWHGHNDRGHALATALAALELGVDRVHGCGLGLGERNGNAPMDLLLVNLELMGALDPARHDLDGLVDYVRLVSRATGIPIPASYPLAGADAFRTASGVHAAAVAKAVARGDLELADRVYSSVPARRYGRSQEIAVGHYSGKANAAWWLTHHGYPASDELIGKILTHAKRMDRILTDDELHALARP